MKSQHDSRTKIVASFILAVLVGSMVISALTSFGIIPPRPLQDWRLLDRVSAVLNCAALGAIVVLATVFLGVKHFTMFTRLDAILTRLPFSICGLALMIFASYTVLTKAYDYHRGLLGLLDAAAMVLGSFLCIWVFLFYGRGNGVGPA